MEYWKPKAVTNYLNQKPTGGSRSVANAPCRKHPNHRQSLGICSVCLTEKLAELSADRSAKAVRSRSPPSSNSSISSYLSSLSSSSYSSPVASFSRRATNQPFVRVSKSTAANVLTKSRSMAAFVPQRLSSKQDAIGKKIARSKRGFWSKLLRRKGKALMHSKTMNERAIKAL